MKGIYKITCSTNNKFYIGSSVDLAFRWIIHVDELKRKKHHNYRLQNDFDMYGLEKFKFEIILQTEDNISIKDLRLIEEGYISTLKPQYNIKKTTGCDISRNRKPRKRGKGGKKRKKKQFASKTFKNLYAR